MKKQIRTFRGEVVKGLRPSTYLTASEIADMLGTKAESVISSMRRIGIKGALFCSETDFHPRRCYSQKEVRRLYEYKRRKHNWGIATPVMAFNESFNGGHIYHFSNPYVCCYTLRKKYKVNITLARIKEMLDKGTSENGWYVDEEL